MFNSKKDTTIEAKVMTIVKQRIADAQLEYDEKALNIDVCCDTDIDLIEKNRVIQKSELANQLATSILGK